MSDSRPPSAPQPVGGGTAVTPPAQGGSVPAGKIPRAFGRYRILDCLGKGGMGAVFRAHDTQLDRTVALKVPFLGGNDADTRQRFYREARAAATLHHPNICPVFDVGEFQGLPYLTMAFIEGRSLAQSLEAGSSFPPTQVAQLVRKVALAMQEAHAKGVIHRDLKPANVLLRPNGEPVIMDFGLARRGDDRQSEGLTRKGDVIGTLEYMSPEQIEGDNAAVGPAADVYALGVVLFELLTGRRPFTGSTTNIMAAILVKPPPRPSEFRPGVPDRLEEICLKAMARKPGDRFPTMGQFAAALGEYLRAPQPGAPPAAPASVPAPPTPPPVAATRRVVERPEPPAAEAPLPASPPRSVVRPRLVSRGKKAKGRSYLPVIIGGAAFVAACLALVVAAVVMRPRGSSVVTQSSDPAPPPSPPAVRPPAPTDDRVSRPPQVRPAPAQPAAKRPTSPADPEPVPAPVLRVRPDAVSLAVGEQREVTVEVDRRGYRGPVHLRWDGPGEVRVSPAGPLTVRPGEPDPVLTVRLVAEPSTDDLRLRITGEPGRDARPAAATADLGVRVTPGPCARVIEVADRTGPAVEAMALTPDASLALVGGGSGRRDGKKDPAEDANAIRVWNLTRGEAVGPLTGHKGRVTELVVSGDGKTALSVSADETVALWDLARGRRESQSPRQPMRVLGTAVSPDARQALVVYPGMIVKVDLDKFRAAGPPIKTAQLTGRDGDSAIRTVAVSAKGRGLAGGADGKLFLLDLAEKARPKPLTGQHGDVLCAAFSPAGDLAATGSGLESGRGNTVCLWDVGAAALKWQADGHRRPVVCVAFAADGRLVASGGADGEVRVWTADDGKPVATFTGHSGRVLALAFSSDGKTLWSGAADRTLRQWRVP